MPRNTDGLWRGGPGRPKGSKDSVPRTVRASVKSVLEEIATDHRDDIREAILKGIKSRPPASLRYIELAAHYTDGKPADTVTLKGPAVLPPIQVILHPDGLKDDGE